MFNDTENMITISLKNTYFSVALVRINNDWKFVNWVVYDIVIIITI